MNGIRIHLKENTLKYDQEELNALLELADKYKISAGIVIDVFNRIVFDVTMSKREVFKEIIDMWHYWNKSSKATKVDRDRLKEFADDVFVLMWKQGTEANKTKGARYCKPPTPPPLPTKFRLVMDEIADKEHPSCKCTMDPRTGIAIEKVSLKESEETMDVSSKLKLLAKLMETGEVFRIRHSDGTTTEVEWCKSELWLKGTPINVNLNLSKIDVIEIELIQPKPPKLEVGQVIEQEDGDMGFILPDRIIFDDGWDSLEEYNENLVSKTPGNGVSIKRIYNSHIVNGKAWNFKCKNKSLLELVWERKEHKYDL